MRIKAYDKYNKQWIIISILDDGIFERSSNSKGVQAEVLINFESVEGDRDSCDPLRWSDLEQFGIIKK